MTTVALKSLIFSKDGVFLNSIKRHCLSAVVVPSQQNTIVKIPGASSATQPGRSVPIPLQGPADAATELYSLNGEEGLTNQGLGVITTDGITATVTGVGTMFRAQIQVGDTIKTTAGTGTVLTISSDTVLTTTVAMAANAAVNYFFSTPISHVNGNQVFVTITDQAWRRKLMNRDVPAFHVFGGQNTSGLNNKPMFMKESSLLETDQTWMLEFTNYSTAAASFAPIAEGRKFQYNALKYKEVYNFIGGLRERKQYLQPYWLTMDRGFSLMGTNTNDRTTELFTCTGDITLVLFNVYAHVYDTSDANQTANVTVQLSDAKTMRNMQTQPVPLNLCTGTGRNPYRLSSPWIVEPQTQIKAEFVRTTSGTAYRVFMTFHGVAIYTGSSFHGSTLTNENLKREAAKMYEAMSVPQIRGAEPQG